MNKIWTNYIRVDFFSFYCCLIYSEYIRVRVAVAWDASNLSSNICSMATTVDRILQKWIFFLFFLYIFFLVIFSMFFFSCWIIGWRRYCVNSFISSLPVQEIDSEMPGYDAKLLNAIHYTRHIHAQLITNTIANGLMMMSFQLISFSFASTRENSKHEQWNVTSI